MLEPGKADYWKSQARKYCEFCKCWIADNRPSIDFHEKGRRHKENVAKKLKYITKKSRRDEQESLKVDATIAQMESAALEAYRKDVENNADITSKAINKQLEDGNLVIAENCKKLWREAKTDTGQTYYWNILSNESVWEPPKEGYTKLSEDNEYSTKWKEYNKKQILHTRLRTEQEKQEKEEERAAMAREKLKQFKVEPIEAVVSAPLIPAGKNDPYGQWKTVQIIPEENVKTINEPEAEEYVGETEAPKKEFKEKTIESLHSGNVQFKKRKFISSVKRNARARLDDD